MEYVGGQDLFDRLHEVQLTGFLSSTGANTSGKNAGNAQVGCYWSMARFYLAEAINGVEHMHRYAEYVLHILLLVCLAVGPMVVAAGLACCCGGKYFMIPRI
jgi:hypothetical protein